MIRSRHWFLLLLWAVALLALTAAARTSVFALAAHETVPESVLENGSQKLKSLKSSDDDSNGPDTVAGSSRFLPRWIFIQRLAHSALTIDPHIGRWLLPEESGEFLL